jgi:hypothetical protein
MLTQLTLVASMSLGLVVQGSTDCPNPEEVAEQLKPLLPEEFGHPERILLLSVENGEVMMALSSEGGDVVAKRWLPHQGSCAEQAKRVAVVAAAWQAELDDEPLPPAPRVETEEIPQVTAAPMAPSPRESSTGDLHFEFGLRMVASPGPNLQFELGMGKSWGRWGIKGNLEGGQVDGPSIAALFGPTFFLLEGYPTLGLRAQGALALGTSQGIATPAPGMEIGFRASTSASGSRGFIDLAYVHYFYGDTPPANQGILSIGFAFGGAG